LDYSIHRYVIARTSYATGVDLSLPGAGGTWPISDELVYQVFFDHPDSVRNYWHRATFGFVDLQFSVLSGVHVLQDHTHALAQGKDGRLRTLAATRRALADAGISLGELDHLVVVTPPWPSDAGAAGGDIAIDQGPGTTLQFLQHEVGHTLGFQHAFGPFVPKSEFDHLYNDAYDVMGFTGVQGRPVSVPPTTMWDGLLMAREAFWQSERRPSGASLLRRYEHFWGSGRVAQVVALPQRVKLFGLCSISDPPDTQVAYLRRPEGGERERLVVEYRPAVPNQDDAGVTSAVVVHSLGVHPVGPGRGEVEPPWFEGSIPPVVGASLNVLGVSFTVAEVSTGPPEFVEIDIDVAPLPPMQSGWLSCARCRCLTLGGPGDGVCHDGNPHDHTGSFHYGVPDGSPGVLPPVQTNWQRCDRCRCLAFSGWVGVCHDGNPHDFSNGARYSVPSGSDAWPGQQGDWRWCNRCQNLAFAGGVTGACHDGNPHDHTTSGKYALYVYQA
jgi:hypothetical protein